MSWARRNRAPWRFQQERRCRFSRSKAKVRRTENTVFGSKVALSFEDGYVDFDRLLSRNVQAQIAANGNFLIGERSALVPVEYRTFCSDVLGLLRSCRSLLDENINLADSFCPCFRCPRRLRSLRGPADRTVARACGFRGNEIVRGVMDHRDQPGSDQGSYANLVLAAEMRAGAI